MNATKIKTRHGLILQALLGTALTQAGFTFRENWQYDPGLERPDFTIPDSDKPQFALEVHQTDARNSFQMKTLRSLNAVAEAKVFFGKNLVSVNILFGDPNTELPESNFKALCGFFDVNLVPRYDSKEGPQAKRLEEQALKLAEDDTHDVASAASKLRTTCKKEIKAISSIVKRSLKGVVADKNLAKIWDLEKKRIAALGPAPGALPTTHYKRCILESLYLSDADFTELIKVRDPNKGSKSLRTQLVDTGLATLRKVIGGERLELIPRMQNFICDPSASNLRSLSEKELKKDPSMLHFFEDIRNTARRKKMATGFVQAVNKGPAALEKSLLDSLMGKTIEGIPHTRCWIADLMPLVVSESHNSFNRRMFQHPAYRENLGNPFNNITICSPRLGTNTAILSHYATIAVKVFFDAVRETSIDITKLKINELGSLLVTLRIGAAIKLQKLNPLYLAAESVSASLGLTMTYGGQNSFIGDQSSPSDPVGKYDLFVVADGKKEVLLNALYVGEGYGSDHKGDEWSARVRALGYRITSGLVKRAKFSTCVFVLDGEWSEKSIKKLHSAGWTHICQLPQVEDTLRSIFGIKKK
jgi:hypothetical protein